MFTILIAYQLQNKTAYNEVVREAAWQDGFQYWDKTFFDQWNPDMRELLLAVSYFPSFTLELAKAVTGNSQAASLIYLAMSVGDFLIKHEDGTYKMLPMIQRYLQWKNKFINDLHKEMDIYSKAAVYYENNGQISEALACYDVTKNEKEISRLLIQNANQHPGTGHYFETRKYYLQLSKEELETSPVLMAGISMLYSLLMQTEKSEYWYDQLKQFEQFMKKDKKENLSMYKEAKRRLLYLDIALPHRGLIGLVDTLRYGAGCITQREFVMPEFSVTSNLPSILNGGKDFCEWTKKDRELARIMKKPLELMLNTWGAGLVNISLAESLFEKGEPDSYEILSLLNSGYTKADLGGKIEMCFVATAVIVRIHISHKQLLLAKNQLKEFEEKAIKENAQRLLPNIHAVYAGFASLEGKQDLVKDWITYEAPNELQEFYILNRYQYLMKVRGYLALGRYHDALNLNERLSVYFQEYHRTYMDMENEVLKAILQYRLKIHQWKDTLLKVLLRLESYHFVYLIAKEGAAVWPLLQELQSDPQGLGINKEYEAKLKQAVYEMALTYPHYLEYETKTVEKLTDMETMILRLYCQGMDTKKICYQCAITYNTLKYHNKNIYRKLGVGSKLEAVKKAAEIGVI